MTRPAFAPPWPVAAVEALPAMWNKGMSGEEMAVQFNSQFSMSVDSHMCLAMVGRLRKKGIHLAYRLRTRLRNHEATLKRLRGDFDAPPGAKYLYHDLTIPGLEGRTTTFGKLKARGCRWLERSEFAPWPSATAWLYCAGHADVGAYCVEHATMAYRQMPTRQRMERFWCV